MRIVTETITHDRLLAQPVVVNNRVGGGGSVAGGYGGTVGNEGLALGAGIYAQGIVQLGTAGGRLDDLTIEMVKSMAAKPIIFAMANPDPEITWEDVEDVRDDAIMATGRSDYPNQVNNVLCFPYIFRGALDCGATKITEAMKLACVREIADLAKAEGRAAPQGANWLASHPSNEQRLADIRRIAAGIATACNVGIDVQIPRGNPVTLNSADGTDMACDAVGRLGVPLHTVGTLSASKLPDAQSQQEATWGLLMSMFAGANLINHATGWLEGGLAMGYEKFMMDLDLCGAADTYLKGVSLDEDQFAMDAFAEVGPGKHFFGSQHTLRHYETAYYDAPLSDNSSFEQWRDAGESTSEQRHPNGERDEQRGRFDHASCRGRAIR